MTIRACLVSCCLLSLVGCKLTENGATSSAMTSKSMRSPLTIPVPEAGLVQVDVALLERPLGDPFLNHELWTHTDEMVVDLDRKAALADNGLRVGQLIGMAPTKLQNLLRSERSCVNPRRRLIASGQSATHQLGPIQPRASYSLRLPGKEGEVAVDQAEFTLEMKATLTKDGRTKLEFVPKVTHGEPRLPIKLAADGTRFEVNHEKPAFLYPELGWEVTLAPNQFLIVGALPDRVESLGHRAFVRDDATQPMQRLLLLRTTRSMSNDGTDDPTLEDLARTNRSGSQAFGVPLAQQATFGAVRASRQ